LSANHCARGDHGRLAGVRVLDLSHILAGSCATQLLADLGVEVVERPGDGDDTRGWGPPFVSGAHEADLFSPYCLAANRGKKSIAVDLSSQDGREIIKSLARSCDVVVKNFSVGVARRLGFDFETRVAAARRRHSSQ
jgi:crotonobetainyl-CoA:carnitine CoA-transferase CaiB-like acyl-CoA transferase